MNLSIGTSLVSRAYEAFATEVEELRLDESAATDHVDSLSELGEEQQLRMQMAMDRLSKMMSTLSNILAKHSETAEAIVGNMK
jgi:hypothetical protein